MRVQCDDELYRVNRTYLGPPRKPWPMRATYRAWGLTVGLTVVFVFAWRLIGLPWHGVLLPVIAFAAYWAAKGLDRKLTADRPVTGEAIRVVQELVAPRPDLAPKATTFAHHVQVRRWRTDAAPDERWWARARAWVVVIPSRVTGVMTGRRDGRVYVEGEWRDVR